MISGSGPARAAARPIFIPPYSFARVAARQIPEPGLHQGFIDVRVGVGRRCAGELSR